MAKKRVYITLEPESVVLAKSMKLNMSEMFQETLNRAIRITLQHMKQNAQSIEEMMQEREEATRIIREETKRIEDEHRQLMKNMLLHARAAKEAGISRGNAESDFGRVFPDAIWNGE